MEVIISRSFLPPFLGFLDNGYHGLDDRFGNEEDFLDTWTMDELHLLGPFVILMMICMMMRPIFTMMCYVAASIQ